MLWHFAHSLLLFHYFYICITTNEIVQSFVGSLKMKYSISSLVSYAKDTKSIHTYVYIVRCGTTFKYLKPKMFVVKYTCVPAILVSTW